VLLSELVSVYVLGLILLIVLEKRKIFKRWKFSAFLL
jgi:hypothetical protein